MKDLPCYKEIKVYCAGCGKRIFYPASAKVKGKDMFHKWCWKE
jgi:hypothetical protein